MYTRLSIGTAQFGMHYGITNRSGEVEIEEMRKIFDYAKKIGIRNIDTAQAYGNAEKKLGQIKDINKNFKILSKLKSSTSPEEEGKDNNSINWEKQLRETKNDLGAEKIESLMVHNADDLKGDEGEKLRRWISEKKREGMINKTGVSIYDSKDLEDLSLDKIDIIQLPISIYNQRNMKEGVIQDLKDKGKEIHARSIFLQGLILNEQNTWPNFITKDFRKHHKRWLEEIKIKKSSPLRETMKYLNTIKEIDLIIIGIENKKQLQEIYMAEKKDEKGNEHFGIWSWANKRDTDPRLWKNV